MSETKLTVVPAGAAALPGDDGATGIVHGLLVRITTAELRTHLRARAEYHTGRAAQKEESIPQLQKAADAVRPEQATRIEDLYKNSGHSGFGPDQVIRDVTESVRDHRNKALMFLFLADHLFPGAVYCLGTADLIRLEVMK